MDLDTIEKILNIIAISLGIIGSVIGGLYGIYQWGGIELKEAIIRFIVTTRKGTVGVGRTIYWGVMWAGFFGIAWVMVILPAGIISEFVGAIGKVIGGAIGGVLGGAMLGSMAQMRKELSERIVMPWAIIGAVIGAIIGTLVIFDNSAIVAFLKLFAIFGAIFGMLWGANRPVDEDTSNS